jgi:hypothetical protein
VRCEDQGIRRAAIGKQPVAKSIRILGVQDGYDKGLYVPSSISTTGGEFIRHTTCNRARYIV